MALSRPRITMVWEITLRVGSGNSWPVSLQLSNGLSVLEMGVPFSSPIRLPFYALKTSRARACLFRRFSVCSFSAAMSFRVLYKLVERTPGALVPGVFSCLGVSSRRPAFPKIRLPQRGRTPCGVG